MGRSLSRRWAVLSLIAAVAMMATFGLSRGSQLAAAQATPVPVYETPGTVTVTGIGRVTIEPDTANVSIGVTVFEPSLDEAQAKATTQMTAIIDAVKAAGVAEADIRTSNFSVNIRQEYDTNGNPTRIIGYDINNTVEVTVRDLDALGSILDSVVDAGANTIYGISFYTWDLTGPTSQARAAAVTDARARADQMASAGGVTVGRIVTMVEGYSAAPPPVYYDRGAGVAEADMAASDPVPVQVGTQQVEVTVTVTYELVQ